MELTQRQENFCKYYVQFGVAAEAYRKAYPASTKWKDKTVHERASVLLKNNKVATRVKELQTKAAKKHDVTVERILKELADIMYFNPQDLYDEKGNLKKINDLPPEIAKVIAEIRVTDYHGKTPRTITNVKVYSKLDAIDKLAKHLGFYLRDNEQKKPEGSVIILPSNNR